MPISGNADEKKYNAKHDVEPVVSRVHRYETKKVTAVDVPEAIMLGNSAYSTYHSAQLSVTKRLSRGLQFNAAYTFSKSIDNASADPGSTAGGGKPGRHQRNYPDNPRTSRRGGREHPGDA